MQSHLVGSAAMATASAVKTFDIGLRFLGDCLYDRLRVIAVFLNLQTKTTNILGAHLLAKLLRKSSYSYEIVIL